MGQEDFAALECILGDRAFIKRGLLKFQTCQAQTSAWVNNFLG
jgi:hypothetical protein